MMAGLITSGKRTHASGARLSLLGASVRRVLHLCREWVTGALLVMNCDVLLQPAVLDRLLQSSGSAFAYDSSSGTDEEPMKVEPMASI